jgi:hypothetical protein
LTYDNSYSNNNPYAKYIIPEYKNIPLKPKEKGKQIEHIKEEDDNNPFECQEE